MKYIFKKYEFESQELAEKRISQLPHVKDEDGNTHPSHGHTIVKLGYIFIEHPTFSDDGEMLTQGLQSDVYSFDVLWRASNITVIDEEGNQSIEWPYGWSSKEITVEGEGVHTFSGVRYVGK